MRRAGLTLCLAAALLAGCGGSGDPSDEQVIRGWNAAVNAGDFERAADYFGKDAIVEQVQVARLSTKSAAVAFNRSLPCRAKVTDIKPEKGSTLAAFELRRGRTGLCGEGGSARVRFVIDGGKIREWRQLPESDVPSGPIARSRTI